MRIERKFLIRSLTKQWVELQIKIHPAGFSEIFNKRQVNNIYFDTPGFNHYSDHVNGETSREKIRIRWYGNTFGEIKEPFLEHKIKRGNITRKYSTRMKGFFLTSGLLREEILSILPVQEPGFPLHIIANLFPSLLNSYTRKYFLSADRNFRLTLDSGIKSYPVRYGDNLFNAPAHHHGLNIVEIKYKPGKDDLAREVTSGFPFRVTKCSKYLKGVERVLF